MYKVMLVDDEANLHESIADLLDARGYAYCGTTEPLKAAALAEREKPDVVLLDVMMPGASGFRVCREIRSSGNRVPIVFLSAKSDISDKAVGFEAGGDDYVTKPFDPEELLMRIGAHIRRYRETSEWEGVAKRPASAVVGDLEVRFDEYRVLLRGEPVPLTAKEFEIVALLAARPDAVFTREQIYERIWGEEGDAPASNNITVLVRRIREKIEDNPSEPKRLLTVQRVGYKLSR